MKTGFIFTMAFQPLPHLIPAISSSVSSGNNALSQLPSYGDRMFMEYDLIWETPLGDSDAQTMAANITEEIQAYTKKIYADIKNTYYKEGHLEYEKCNPIFLNDVTHDQRLLQSCGKETYERLKRIQRSVDPEGVFATRTGWFKFT
jgi:hypothetical protein